MLSWRINNSDTFVVGQTQQGSAFRFLGVSVYWLDFTVVSLGKKFTWTKPFSFQTSCSRMVQKTVAINLIVPLGVCVSILGIYWARNLEETNSSAIAITLSLLMHRLGHSSSTYQPTFPFCLIYPEDDKCNNALKIFKHLQKITLLTPETKVSLH